MCKLVRISHTLIVPIANTYGVGYPHNCLADKRHYRHDRRADKLHYRHDRGADSLSHENCPSERQLFLSR